MYIFMLPILAILLIVGYALIRTWNVGGRLKSISTVMMIAVATFGLMPIVFWACLIAACWGHEECF